MRSFDLRGRWTGRRGSQCTPWSIDIDSDDFVDETNRVYPELITRGVTWILKHHISDYEVSRSTFSPRLSHASVEFKTSSDFELNKGDFETYFVQKYPDKVQKHPQIVGEDMRPMRGSRSFPVRGGILEQEPDMSFTFLFRINL